MILQNHLIFQKNDVIIGKLTNKLNCRKWQTLRVQINVLKYVVFYLDSFAKQKKHGLQKSDKNISLLVFCFTERLQAVEQRTEPGPGQVRDKRL